MRAALERGYSCPDNVRAPNAVDRSRSSGSLHVRRTHEWGQRVLGIEDKGRRIGCDLESFRLRAHEREQRLRHLDLREMQRVADTHDAAILRLHPYHRL